MLKYFLVPVVFAVCGAVGWYTFQHVEKNPVTVDQPPQPARLAVTVAPVTARAIADEIELVGSLEANAEVVIRAPVRGYITHVSCDVGDSVQGPTKDVDGQLVIQLDDELLREKLSGMQAALRVQQADIRAHEARRNLAEATVKRQIPALASAAVTQQEYEESLAQLEISKAELALSNARLAERRSAVEEARIELDSFSLTAPISGQLAERLVDVGDLANPDDPLLKIVSIDKIKMLIHVSETDYPKIQLGQHATVQVDPLPHQSFTGQVIRKAPVLDPETRTSQIFVEIPNTEQLLKPGMHARVKLVFQQRQAAQVIPKTALLNDQDRPAVFVVVDGNPPVARRCPVRVGMVTNQLVEILQGLETGQQVVVLGNRLIKNGQEVSTVSQSEALRVAEF